MSVIPFTQGSELFDDVAALAVQPPDAPYGLNGRHYRDEAHFAAEAAGLLARGWHCLGRVDEIPRTGDFFTVDLLSEPLAVLRDEAGAVRVFSNLCRHRNMPLLAGAGSAKRLICSYHAWTYGLDGGLLRAPRMANAGFDAKSCRLPEFQTRLWRGFIYVSLADDPPAFVPEGSALDAMLAPYATERFRLVHRAEEDWQCNWKALVENFMEGYHLSVVHPQTLHGYTPTGLAQKGPSGDGFTSYHANYPKNIPARGDGAPGLSDAERNRSSLFSVFPCQVASQAASLLVSLSIFPRSAERITVKWTMSVHGDDLDDATIAERIALWEEVNREDREKLERMQRAMHSRHAHAGPLAGPDYEGTVRDFHLWLAAQVQPANANERTSSAIDSAAVSPGDSMP